MKKLLQTLKAAFQTLFKTPKLFLPKLFAAALYGIEMVWIAGIYLEMLGLNLDFSQPSPEKALLVQSLLVSLVFCLIFFAITLIIDVLINAMYPVLVYDYYKKKKLSFINSFRFSLSKSLVVVPAVLASLAISMAIAFPFTFLFDIFLLANNLPGMIISGIFVLITIFLTTVMFYLLYPVTTLEKQNFLHSLVRTFRLSKKNLKDVSIASLIPFSVSLVNFALAFFIENPAALIAFIAVRFLVALVHTYHMVLNPSIYLAYEKHLRLHEKD